MATHSWSLMLGFNEIIILPSILTLADNKVKIFNRLNFITVGRFMFPVM